MDLAAGVLLSSSLPAGPSSALAPAVSGPYNRGLQLLRHAAGTAQRRVLDDADGDELLEDTEISQLTQAEQDQLLSAASKGKDCKKLRRLLRNRICAQQARERKKQEVCTLKVRVAEQEAHIAALQARVAKAEGDNATLRRLILTIRNPAGTVVAAPPGQAPPPAPAAAAACGLGAAAAAGGSPARNLLAQAEAVLAPGPAAGPLSSGGGLPPDQAAEVPRQQKRQRLMALAQQRVQQQQRALPEAAQPAGQVGCPLQQQQQPGVNKQPGDMLSSPSLMPGLLPRGGGLQGELFLGPGAPQGPGALSGEKPLPVNPGTMAHAAAAAAAGHTTGGIGLYGVVPSMVPSAATAAAGATAAWVADTATDVAMCGAAPSQQQQQQQQQQASNPCRMPSSGGLSLPPPRPPGAPFHNPEVRRAAMLAMLAKQSCLALTLQQQQQEVPSTVGAMQPPLPLGQPSGSALHTRVAGAAVRLQPPCSAGTACSGPSPGVSGVALLPGGLQLPEGSVASQGLHMSALGPANQVLQLQQMVDQELDALQGQLQRQLSRQQQQQAQVQEGSKKPPEQYSAAWVMPSAAGALGLAGQQHAAVAAEAHHPLLLPQQPRALDALGNTSTGAQHPMRATRDVSKLAELGGGTGGDGTQTMASGISGHEEQVAGVVPDVQGPSLAPLLSSRSSLADIWAAMGGK